MISQVLKLFKFLWPFCKKNQKYFYLLSIFISLSVLLEIPLPLFLKYFIDTIIKNENLTSLKLFALLLISLVFFKFVIDNLKNYFLFAFKEKTFINLQGHIFNEVLKVKYNFYEQNNTGYIVSRIHNEVLNLQRFLWDFFIKLFTDLLMFMVGLYFIFRFSVKLSIISLLLLPFFVFTLVIFSKKIKEHSDYFQEAYSNVYGFFYELVQMIFLVKTLLLYDFANSKLKNILLDFYHVKKKNSIVNVLFSTLIALIGGLSPIIVLYIGGLEIINNKLSLGTLIAFNSFLGYIYGPTRNILNYGSDLASSLASYQRIHHILNLNKEKDDGDRLSKINKIELKDVNFSYNSLVALSNINFKIERGEKIGILGKIGSGKTTLIKLLLGLYDNYSGEILVNDKNIKSYSKITEKIGVIPQDDFLFSDTIYNNIRIGNPQKDVGKISELVEKLRLNEMIKKKENGINYKLDYQGIGLSGGEKQKIVAARLFFRNPDLVIIDEGTSNLDAENENFILENICDFFKDRIIVIISHRFNNIIKCDKIIYLKEGRIIDVDIHENLYKKYDEYKELYLKQTENNMR